MGSLASWDTFSLSSMLWKLITYFGGELLSSISGHTLGFFPIWKIKSFVLYPLFLTNRELTIFGCWTSFLFSYFYFPSLCPFVLLFDNVPQLYFLFLLLPMKAVSGKQHPICMLHDNKEKGTPSEQRFQASIKGKWSQTLQRPVLAVRPGELRMHYRCSVWQGLLYSFGFTE